jgi:U4/U6 small nuclear ribonucleoprotein PRP3
MYLTKKERKRIRRQARAEREREKRDKMIMGLIPAPETKFKLSNFMKILGDQAVADPSKVEMRVIKEMQKRQLNHEMRNLARKLTPAERREKKRKKLLEDTSRQVHVAVFSVKDLSFGKLRFKVDVNAQQYNLTGSGKQSS